MEGFEVSKVLEESVMSALEAGEEQFEIQGEVYTLTRENKDYILGKSENAALESTLIIDPAQQNLNVDFDFKYAAEKTIRDQDSGSFSANGQMFEVEEHNNISVIYQPGSNDRIPYAIISSYAMQPSSPEMF